jgi:immune inhibitor A
LNRRPLLIGISTALVLCVCLMGIVAFYIAAQSSAPGGADATPRVTAEAGESPAAATPSGATSSAQPTPPGTKTVEADDAASLNTLLSTNVGERDLITLTHRLKKVTQPIPLVVNDTPPSFKVGDQRKLWVADQPNKKNFTTTATLHYVTAHVYAWVENSERIDDNALKKSVDIFENKIYVTDRQFFGSEWSPGIDNDVHVNIYNGNVPGVGGYFSSADEYPRIVNQFSNQGEWFYINTRDVRPGTSDYEGVLAHEFQHMIHWNNDKNEDTWVNEGLSELAMRLNGYSVGGSDTAFIRDPDVQLNAWRDQPNDSVPHYGAAFLFNSYFLERFGDKLTQELVRDRGHSTVGYDNVLQHNNTGLKFDDVFQDWLIANILNDPSLDKRYGYKDLRTKPISQSTAASLPWKKTLDVHEYGAQYIDVKAPARAGDYTLTLQGATTVKIANTDAHSGKYVWYSNRGDDSDMTLTHAFDLGSVTNATLNAWLWYDIEKDFDYGFVEVSSDNGATWDTLKGQHTVGSNPNGTNFGNGYTGRDGQWYQEHYDLSPYAGKRILVRFEYITDDAFNATGMLVDDISIPELNYSDNVENGDGGWQADGFVRVTDFLPQKYSVQLIRLGGKTTVEKIALDSGNSARVPLKNFGGDLTRAILVISGLTPVTTETTPFDVSIAP